jgi:SSS family solute:Na+ symporter
LIGFVSESELSKMFFFDDYKSANFFWKQFLSGAFITIVMTGLDQDMMQKNLTCKSLKDAQKNMFWFTIVLVLVNLVFLVLGLLLISFAQQNNIAVDRPDLLFPTIATQSGLGLVMALFFCLGLISAAFSSADGTLTSLTTSFCIDILDIEKKYDLKIQEKIRKQVHKATAVVFILTMLVFEYIIKDESVIERLFVFAGYTYGPLLALFAFGLFTRFQLKDRFVPIVAILSPILSYIISVNSLKWLGFEFGFFILILNGFLAFMGLVLIRAK